MWPKAVSDTVSVMRKPERGTWNRVAISDGGRFRWLYRKDPGLWREQSCAAVD